MEKIRPKSQPPPTNSTTSMWTPWGPASVPNRAFGQLLVQFDSHSSAGNCQQAQHCGHTSDRTESCAVLRSLVTVPPCSLLLRISFSEAIIGVARLLIWYFVMPTTYSDTWFPVLIQIVIAIGVAGAMIGFSALLGKQSARTRSNRCPMNRA